MVIASGLMLWLPFLDSQVPSAYKMSGNSTAPCMFCDQPKIV